MYLLLMDVQMPEVDGFNRYSNNLPGVLQKQKIEYTHHCNDSKQKKRAGSS